MTYRVLTALILATLVACTLPTREEQRCTAEVRALSDEDKEFYKLCVVTYGPEGYSDFASCRCLTNINAANRTIGDR